MSFNQRSLDRIGKQTRGAFNTYLYKTIDSSDEVLSVGYFAASRFKDIDGPQTNSRGWIGGIITVVASDRVLQVKILPDGATAEESTGVARAVAAMTGSSNTGLYFGENQISTTDNSWAQISSITLPNGLQTPINYHVTSVRTDANGIRVQSRSGVAANYGSGSVHDINTLSVQHIDGFNLNARERDVGNDLVFEVRGRSGQSWDWNIVIWGYVVV